VVRALGISGIAADIYSWKSRNSDPGAQIDLVISRADRIVNLCEVKFAKYEFEIRKDYADKLRKKVFTFGNETGLAATTHLTFITTQEPRTKVALLDLRRVFLPHFAGFEGEYSVYLTEKRVK